MEVWQDFLKERLRLVVLPLSEGDGSNGWHTLSVAGEGRDSGVADLKRLEVDADIRPSDAGAIIGRVADLCSGMESMIAHPLG